MDYRPKLIELLKGQFDNATKYKGKEYFRQDRVTFKNVDGQSASFKVLGSRSY